MEGTVAIPSTEGANPTTIYNDQTYYLDYKEKNIDNNKGLVWQVRLFEDNTNPTNVIQSGEIMEILFNLKARLLVFWKNLRKILFCQKLILRQILESKFLIAGQEMLSELAIEISK